MPAWLYQNMIPIIFSLLTIIGLAFILKVLSNIKQHQHRLRSLLSESNQAQEARLERLKDGVHQIGTNQQQHQTTHFKQLLDSLQKTGSDQRQQISQFLQQNSEHLSQRLNSLTQITQEQLKTISGQVDKRLSEGFEKTTATFQDVIKRLALIDEAQKKITELSSNVVSLQEVLVDKRSRGAFGEVQLSALINNTIPAQHVSWQHTLSNGKRADCLLSLPEPTGNVAIDAKFPLENYQRLTDPGVDEGRRKLAEQAFKQDIKLHIKAIAEKYIIPPETADGAIMFIPAEAIFAEIHASYPELVELAQRSRVWLVSPTTLMAILTTARAVLKDAATRKQIHIIQEHIHMLATDFQRFEKRMGNLNRHIAKAHQDAEEVNTSARKISKRFTQIEEVELQREDAAVLE